MTPAATVSGATLARTKGQHGRARRAGRGPAPGIRCLACVPLIAFLDMIVTPGAMGGSVGGRHSHAVGRAGRCPPRPGSARSPSRRPGSTPPRHLIQTAAGVWRQVQGQAGAEPAGGGPARPGAAPLDMHRPGRVQRGLHAGDRRETRSRRPTGTHRSPRQGSRPGARVRYSDCASRRATSPAAVRGQEQQPGLRRVLARARRPAGPRTESAKGVLGRGAVGHRDPRQARSGSCLPAPARTAAHQPSPRPTATRLQQRLAAYPHDGPIRYRSSASRPVPPQPRHEVPPPVFSRCHGPHEGSQRGRAYAHTMTW